MTKTQAKQLAKTIADQEIVDLLWEARIKVADWKKPARENKGLSRGTFWNVLQCGAICRKENPASEIVKYRILMEFGEYLPENLRPKPRKKPTTKPPVHQDPIF